jgi:methylated-DNA-[protein]-cysteine S-methyltransferase
MIIETKFGPAWASITPAGALQAFGFGEPPAKASGESETVARQIAEYCEGTRTSFDLDLEPVGTEFQKRVWAELMRIPYGETISYLQLAERVGVSGAARAVGRANATNPIALVVPCHRVIGSNGALTGYAYGTELKKLLLDWETKHRD